MFEKRASKALYSLQNHLFHLRFVDTHCNFVPQGNIINGVFCFPLVLVSIAERSPMNFMLTLKTSTFILISQLLASPQQ